MKLEEGETVSYVCCTIFCLFFSFSFHAANVRSLHIFYLDDYEREMGFFYP